MKPLSRFIFWLGKRIKANPVAFGYGVGGVLAIAVLIWLGVKLT